MHLVFLFDSFGLVETEVLVLSASQLYKKLLQNVFYCKLILFKCFVIQKKDLGQFTALVH